jgi:hypothetical protein
VQQGSDLHTCILRRAPTIINHTCSLEMQEPSIVLTNSILLFSFPPRWQQGRIDPPKACNSHPWLLGCSVSRLICNGSIKFYVAMEYCNTATHSKYEGMNAIFVASTADFIITTKFHTTR